MNILPHRGIVRRVIETLRSGAMVVVLADQRGDDSRPIWVELFGMGVLANGVFAKFAVESRAYVFPVMSRRTSDGRYLCEFGKEMPIRVTRDHRADLTVNSQLFHNVFEAWHRKYPGQGFWMCRKFKRKAKRAKKNGCSSFKPSRLQHDT